MKKNIIIHGLMAVLLLTGLTAMFAACSDDDDNTSEQRNADADPMDTDEAHVAWRWLCALTDAQELETNWSNKSYEPTVGVASENNANTRIVVVNSIDEAKSQFADLADVEITKLGNEYTFSQSGVGRMTWTPSKQGAQNLAEVSVDTKLIPHLQKIVYCTEDQVGENGIFWTNVEGAAYYRFGDVIRNSTTGAYWVCVRPAFQQGDKGDSHWMCIYNAAAGNPIPEENMQTKWNKLEKYNGKTIILPTKLKFKREHLNNLANFVIALLDPAAFASQVDNNGKKNGLGGFDYQYHGRKFLTRVSDFWDQQYNGKTIWELLFNQTHDQMSTLQNLAFIYNGYHWTIGNTGSVHEFKASRQAGFQPTAPGSESGDKAVYSFGTEGYDLTRYDSHTQSDQDAGGPVAFREGDTGYWVVAYAKGEDLMQNGKYSPYEAINGFEEIYNYNKKTGVQPHDKDLETEDKLPIVNNNKNTWNTDEYDGPSYYTTGDVYKDEQGHRWIVMRMAGNQADNSPYTELVSFEGLKASNDNQKFTNVPSYNEVLRVIPSVWFLCKEAYTKVAKDEAMENDESTLPVVLRHIRDYADVDMRWLVQVVKDFHGGRPTELFSVPYKDETDQKQKLLRFIEEADNSNNDMTLWFWKHYPKIPSAKEQWQKDFSEYDIYLQDVANQGLVDQWAEDAYARQPIWHWLGEGSYSPDRLPRKEYDERALNVNNYIHKRDVWRACSYPTDMWNEPLMCVRVTAIYDRGQECATTTVDGHKLTLHHGLTVVGEDVEPEGKTQVGRGYLTAFWSTFGPQFVNSASEQIKLDGKTVSMPTWDNVWNPYK